MESLNNQFIINIVEHIWLCNLVFTILITESDCPIVVATYKITSQVDRLITYKRTPLSFN